MYKSNKKMVALATVIASVPTVVLADTVDELFRPGGILMTTFNTVVGILFVLASIIFLWGVIQFIAKSGDEAARNKAKAIMTWGIVGLAVMAAAWGVVNVLTRYFLNVNVDSQFQIPTRPGQF